MYGLMAKEALESGMFDKLFNMFGKKNKEQNKTKVVKAVEEFDALKNEVSELKLMMRVLMDEAGIKDIVKKYVVEKNEPRK